MDINQRLEQILNFYESGGNPKQLMQSMYGNNLQQGQTQLQNMAQGRSPQEFIMQMARQNGVSDRNLQRLAQMFSAKK